MQLHIPNLGSGAAEWLNCGNKSLPSRHSVASFHQPSAVLQWLVSCSLLSEETIMKALVSILALSLVMAFTAPAFAGAPKTEAACKKAGKMWDAATKKCS